MTKILQGWMVVPALVLAYLIAGRPALRVRIRQLAVFGAVMVAVSAAWPAAVSLWPGAKRYIGGSTDGSVWNLILGYNGFGRLTGSEGGVGGGASFGGAAGLWRMSNQQVGGQIAWLRPLAGVSLAAGLWLTWEARRTSLRRAAWILFGVWALVHVAVFSSQKGIFHPYYTSALAPAVAALSGAGIVALWGWARRSWAAWAILAATVAGSAWLAGSLLSRTADFAPWLRVAIPVAAAVAIVASVALRAKAPRALLAVAVIAGTFALAAGPASYSVASVSRSLNGNNVAAGPAGASIGGFGGGPAGRAGGRSAGARAAGGPPGATTPGAAAVGAAGGAATPGAGAAGGPSGATMPGTRAGVSASLISYEVSV